MNIIVIVSTIILLSLITVPAYAELHESVEHFTLDVVSNANVDETITIECIGDDSVNEIRIFVRDTNTTTQKSIGKVSNNSHLIVNHTFDREGTFTIKCTFLYGDNDAKFNKLSTIIIESEEIALSEYAFNYDIISPDTVIVNEEFTITCETDNPNTAEVFVRIDDITNGRNDNTFPYTFTYTVTDPNKTEITIDCNFQTTDNPRNTAFPSASKTISVEPQTQTLEPYVDYYNITTDYNKSTREITINWDLGDNPYRTSCNLKTEFYNNHVIGYNSTEFVGLDKDDGYEVFHFLGTDITNIMEGGQIILDTKKQIDKTTIDCKGSLTMPLDDYNFIDMYWTFYEYINPKYTDQFSDYYIPNELDNIRIIIETQIYISDEWIIDTPGCGELDPNNDEFQFIEFVYDSNGFSTLTYDPVDGCYIGQFESIIETKKKSGGSNHKWKTKPTFGLSHSTFQPQVQCGYQHNGVCYDITDNWYTSFDKVEIIVGEPNEIIIKGKYTNGIKGVGWGLVPEVGEFHKAEVKIFAYTNYSDEIEKTEINQTYNIIDFNSIEFEYYTEPCVYVTSTCDVIKMSNVIFMDVPKFEKIAIYGVDDQRRTQTTFLNEGYGIEGESLNEPLIVNVASSKGGALYPQQRGTVELTLIDYKNDIWQDEDGYLWTSNNYKSFKITSTISAPIQEPDVMWQAMTRMNNNFPAMIIHEQQRAILIYDASKYASIPGESIATDIPTTEELAAQEKELQERIKSEADRAENELQEYFDKIYPSIVYN